MDKFGFFDLLDTLAQIATDAQPQKTDSPASPPTRVSPDDKAFLPPEFDRKPPNETSLPRNALNALYERHENISKRIDKKK